jgi:hypothetical protein
MASRRKSFLNRIINVIIISLALFGAWTLYKQRKSDVARVTSKALKSGKSVANKFSKNLVSLKINESGWICWFNATDKALEVCRVKRSCSGMGTWGSHPQKEKAYMLASDKCIAEYGECVFDYCSKE